MQTIHLWSRLGWQAGKVATGSGLNCTRWASSNHHLTRLTSRVHGKPSAIARSCSASAAEAKTDSGNNILYSGHRRIDNPAIYDDAYGRSINNPTEFWAAAAEDIVWTKKWDKVIDNTNEPFTKWFAHL